jgi:hypothetical protein
MFYGIQFSELIVKIQECTNKCTVLRYNFLAIKTLKLRHDPEEEGGKMLEFWCFNCENCI